MPKWMLILILLGAGVLIVSALNSTTETEPPSEPARLPNPSFDWEPVQPKTEQTILFTTDFSDPNDVVSAYRWSFGDGSGSDRSFVQHSYDDEGSYRVCLTIRDAQGRSEQECQQIRVQGRNKPPEAAFHWQPTQPDVGQTIQFISDASDPEGQLSSYQWDLGDGTSKTSASFSYAYGSSGTYRVCLSVRDAQGLSNSTCRSLKVGPNKTGFIIPPMSSISSNDSFQPTWAPDGGQILFTTNRDGNWELYTVDVDSFVSTRLTNNSGVDFAPDWGTNGQVAFVSDRDNQSGTDIYTMDYDSRGVTRITFDPGNLNKHPAWIQAANATPGVLVYHSDLQGNREIYRKDTQSGNFTPLSSSPADDWNADVSPDGSQIAFQHEKDGHSQIYVMDSDGGQLKRLTFNNGENVHPSWSPDGELIAFSSNHDGNFKIYTIDPESLTQRVVTQDNFNSTHPDWSPDGNRIAFSSDRSGNWEIWAVSPQGENLKRITGVSQ